MVSVQATAQPAAQPAQMRAEPRLSSAPQAPAEPAPEQPQLTGLAPAEPDSAEDDMLDIPAFLRRQAN